MFVDSRDQFENLFCSNVQFPQLSKLTLCFSQYSCQIYHKHNKQCKFRWLEIFQNIENKFAKTLEYISLELPTVDEKETKAQNYQDSSMFQLCLPKLKRVSLVLEDHTSLDFLLLMKDTIEIIDLDIRYTEKDEIKMTLPSVVQLRGFKGNVGTSNIPYLFTNLKRVTVKDRTIVEKDPVFGVF